MFMKQRVKQLAITERSVKMKKIVAVVIIMFIFSIIILGVGSKLVFQKICERRETAWPDLGTADDEQYEWLTEAYKIKQKNNEKIVILASDGTKLEGHYYERKKNAPLVIFFMGLEVIVTWMVCRFIKLRRKKNGMFYLLVCVRMMKVKEIFSHWE